MKLPSLSPYRSPGHCAVWRGGQVMLWMWDRELQLALAAQGDELPRHYGCVPETLLQSPAPVNEQTHVRLLGGRLGHDLQVWKSGVLLLSIHYMEPPSLEQMSLVLRGVAGIDARSGIALEQAQYLTLPWAGGGQGIQADWERWVPRALLAFLLLGGGFQLTQGLSWWMGARSLQAEHEQLVEQLDNLLTARTRAQQALDAIETLQQRMQASPLQIELLRRIAGLLPPDSKLSHWRFAGNDLELLVTTQNMDPRFFVKRLEEEGGFAQLWQRIARKIEAATDIDYKWPWLDQLALPLALADLQRHTEVLSERYNYPLHRKPLVAGNDPYFCHYHDPEVLAREPSLLRDLQALQAQWPELARTLELYPAWRQVCNDMKAVLRTAESEQKAESEGTDLIITGLPRSGTSFLCRLLSERQQTVVINEPAQIFQSLIQEPDPWGIPCFYEELRREILAGRPVLNKHVNGRLVDDTARQQDMALPYQVSSPLHGFTLGTKNTLAYLVRLPALLRVMPKATVIALVRHPYDCLASWVSTFEHLRNADLLSQPLGNPDDPALSERSRVTLREISSVSNLTLRRALWWRFLVVQLLEAGPRVRWMRYEDLIAAPERMTELLLSQEPLPVLTPVAWRKVLPSAERDLIAAVLCDVAERLQYIL